MADAVPSTSSSTSSTSSSRAARASTRAAAAEARTSILAAPLHPSLLSFHSLLEFIDSDLAGAVRLKLVAAPLPPHTTPISSVLSIILVSSPPSLIKLRNGEEIRGHDMNIIITIIGNKGSMVTLSDKFDGVKGLSLTRRVGFRAKSQLQEVLAVGNELSEECKTLLPIDLLLSLLQPAAVDSSIMSISTLDSTWQSRLSLVRRIDSDEEEEENEMKEENGEKVEENAQGGEEDQEGEGESPHPHSSTTTGGPSSSSTTSTKAPSSSSSSAVARRRFIREHPEVEALRRSLQHRVQAIDDRDAELAKLKGIDQELKQCKLQKQQLGREMAQAEGKMRKLEEECRGYALGKIMMEKREMELSGKDASLTEKESRQREAKADLEGKIRSMEGEKEEWTRLIKHAELARDEARSEMDKTRLNCQAKIVKAESALQAALHKAEMSEKQAENERKLREEARKQWERDEKEWKEHRDDLITKLNDEKRAASDQREILKGMEVAAADMIEKEKLLVEDLVNIKGERDKSKEKITRLEEELKQGANLRAQVNAKEMEIERLKEREAELMSVMDKIAEEKEGSNVEIGRMAARIVELEKKVADGKQWHADVRENNLAILRLNHHAEIDRRRKRQAEYMEKKEGEKKAKDNDE